MVSSAKRTRTTIAVLASLALALLLFATTSVSQAQAAQTYSFENIAACGGEHNSGSSDRYGNVYLPCGNPSVIRMYEPDGDYNPANNINVGFYVSDVAPSPAGDVLYLAQANVANPDNPFAVQIRRMVKTNGVWALKDAHTPNSGSTWKLGTYKNGAAPAAKGWKIDTDGAGNIYVADGGWATGNLHTIVKYNAEGQNVTYFGGNATSGGVFKGNLTGVAVNKSGSKVYAMESWKSDTNDGNLLHTFVSGNAGNSTYTHAPAPLGARYAGGCSTSSPNDAAALGMSTSVWTTGYFAAPWDVEVDGDGNVYVLNTTCFEVLRFSPTLTFETGMKVGVYTPGVSNEDKPHGLAVSVNGEVYVGQNDAKMADNVAPTATVTPANNANPVAVSSSVETKFSEFMDKSSLSGANFTLKKNGAANNVAATISFDDLYTPKVATLHPTSALDAASQYTATLSGVKDMAGNPLPVKTWTFTTANAAGVAPDTILDPNSGPTAGSTTTNTAVSFSFSADPAAGASFECKLDATDWEVCVSPKAYNALSVAQHTFSVRAKNANGTDATPATRTWTVDSVPPGTCLGEASTMTGSDDPNASDNLTGRVGLRDVIDARRGADTIRTLDNTDVACGGAGYDTFTRFSGSQIKIDGGNGPADDASDVADFSWITQADANGRGAYVAISGVSDGLGFEVTMSNVADAKGSSFPDSMYGDEMRNTIEGGGGNDTIHGGAEAAGAGGDKIYGEAGSDTIKVRDGSIDTVYCGESEGDLDTVEADTIDVIMDDPNTAGNDCEQVLLPDTVKPVVTPISPKPGSAIRDRTPTIRATVRDDVTDLVKGDVQLYVGTTLISATSYSYDPGTNALVYNSPRLPVGKKTVKIVATDAANNVGARTWSFTIRR